MSQTAKTLTDQQVDTLLREALSHLTRREFVTAERMLDIVLGSRPDSPHVLHVFGQLRHLQNRLPEAQGLYRRALAIDPAHPEIQYHLGQALVIAGQVDEAVCALKDSIRLRPEQPEAHLELGMALSRKQDFLGAERAYREALRLAPDLLAARHAISTTLISLGRAKEAEAVARAALPQAASDARWYSAFKHTIAIAISEQHRYDDAVHAYEDVQAIAPTLPFLDHNCANALQASGRSVEAEALYRRALAREPLDLLAHRGLAQLLWQLGRGDYLEHYEASAKSFPAHATLLVEKGRQLLLYDQNEAAHEAFARALHIAPHDERAREGLASSLSRLGRYADAISEFESIAARWPNSAEIRSGLSECFLRAGEGRKALAAADEALRSAPNNQLALALRLTALRLLGDAGSDFETLVQGFDLTPPEGYADNASFHHELASYLERLLGALPPHDAVGLRLISRTSGTIFGGGESVITTLRAHLDKAVAAYVAGLPEDATHPFLRRRDKELRYAKSWATRVAPGGSIPNHIHDNGWISAVYFASGPDPGGDERSGSLKFGEPPFDAHLSEPIARLVKPEPGRLVLFPSYLWHGSIAFETATPRITLSFDAIPEASRD